MKTLFTTLLLLICFGICKAQTDILIQNQTITIGDLEREYHVYIPDSPKGAPLVLLFHGHTGNYNDIIGLDDDGNPNVFKKAPYRRWLTLAKEENIMLLIPNGNKTESTKGWNDCRSDAEGNTEEDDVLFVSTLINKIVNTYQPDPKRIYANGTSNGGHFCIRLAQEIPEKIAAFASIVAANAANSECLTSSVPVSALFMNGNGDPIMPYQGGQMPDNRGKVLSTSNTIDYWIDRNETNLSSTFTLMQDINENDNSNILKYEYKNGRDNSSVLHYEVIDGGHTEPSILERYIFPFVPLVLGNQNGDIEMADEVWKFFKDKSRVVTVIEALLNNNQINIFPNPAKDILSIEIGKVCIVDEIKLISASGKTIKTYNSNIKAIDISELSPGIYILKFECSNGTITKKFIKQ